MICWEEESLGGRKGDYEWKIGGEYDQSILYVYNETVKDYLKTQEDILKIKIQSESLKYQSAMNKVDIRLTINS